MPRPIAAGLVVLLLLVATPAPAVAVSDARVTVSGVTVTPTTPVTGAPVTVSVTVDNGGGSPEAVEVRSVRLEGDRTLARASDLGSLSPGGSLTVPLTATFGEAGANRLTVVVRGVDEDGDVVEVTRPLLVVVESAPPLVEFANASGTAVAGADTPEQVVVSNPTASTMRNLVVTLATPDGEAVVGRRTVASLDAGASETLNFTVRYRRPGETTLEARVGYTTASGTTATTSLERPVAVESLVDDVGVRVDTRPAEEAAETQPQGQLGALLGGGGAPSTGATRDRDEAGQPTRVSVTVSNFGNAPISDVVVTPRVGDATLPRVPVEEPIQPGTESTVEVSLERAPAGAVTFDVSYAAAGDEGRVSTTFDNRPGRGEVRITGVNLSVVEEGDRLRVRLSGNAGNTGQTPITGLVVAVGESRNVAPAYPQRDYFVGTVDGSEFAPFELSATADANATAVPVVVSYRVDGVAREETISVPLERPLDGEGRPSGVSLSLLGALLATVLVGAGVVFVVRRGHGRLPRWGRKR